MYKTLQKLREALHAGEVNPALILVIDNDSCAAYVPGVNGDEDDSVKVFDMHPAQLLEEALDLLDIPHENA